MPDNDGIMTIFNGTSPVLKGHIPVSPCLEKHDDRITRINILFYLYVVSESGTIEPSEIVDTLMARPLFPGGSIIIPSDF